MSAAPSDDPARVEALRLIEAAVTQASSAQSLLKRLAWHWEKDAGTEAIRLSEEAAATLAKAAKAARRAEKEAAASEKEAAAAQKAADKEAARQRTEREKEAVRAEKARLKADEERRRMQEREAIEKERAELEQAKQAAQMRKQEPKEDLANDTLAAEQEAQQADEGVDDANDELEAEDDKAADDSEQRLLEAAKSPSKAEQDRAKKEERAAKKEAERLEKERQVALKAERKALEKAEKEAAAAEHERKAAEKAAEKAEQERKTAETAAEKAAEKERTATEKRASSAASGIASQRLDRRESNGRRAWQWNQAAEDKHDADGKTRIKAVRTSFREPALPSVHEAQSQARRKSEAEGSSSTDKAGSNSAAAAVAVEMPHVNAPAWLSAWRRGAVLTAEATADVTFAGDCLSVGEDGEAVYCVDTTKVGVYSASEGVLLRSLEGHADIVNCVTSDGDVIASGGKDKTIKLWSASTFACTATLKGSDDQINGLALRGDLLFSGEGSAKGGKAHLWSIKDARITATFAEHRGAVWSVALGAEMGVTASHDTSAKVWALDATGRAASAHTLEHPSYVFSVSVDEQTQLAATSCGDRLVRLWSLAANVCLRTFEHAGGTGGGDAAAFRDGLFPFCVHMLHGVLVSGGGPDRSVKLWSLAGDGECIQTFVHGSTIRGVAVSPLGFVASVGGKLKQLLIWGPGSS